MNRRKLLGILGLIPAATAVASVEPPTTSGYPIIKGTESIRWRQDGKLTEYRGYRLIWTGWKECQSRLEYVGKWVAYWKDNVHALYVSNPGGWGQMQRGDDINLGWHWPQMFVEPKTPIHIVKRVEGEMYDVLILLIDYISDKELQEVDFWSGPRLEPLLVHPELPGYTGWKRFSPQEIEDLRNEVRIAAEQGRDAGNDFYGLKA